MIVMFTGSASANMSAEQIDRLEAHLLVLNPTHAIHGDAIHRDAQFHDIVRELLPNTTISIYPANIAGKRAFKKGDYIFEPRPPIERNHTMVDKSLVVLACPLSRVEIVRSGTWATIRYARECGKRVVFI